jgi:hypothetical protein
VIHQKTHPGLDVEGCFACRVSGIHMGMNSTTTRGKNVASINSTERNWQKDMPAYKRLRSEGLQPKSIDGAARIESRANEKWQVESGIGV